MAHQDTFDRVGRALTYLEENRTEQPGLDEVARHVDMSPYHFQRLFSRWVGISPKRFLQFLTVEHARRCLEQSRTVLDATYDAGLSSPGRLHDLFVNVDAVTPGEYKAGGAGLTIRYGVHDSPFGACLIGSTDRGVCWLSFHEGDRADEGISSLRDGWPNATIIHDPDKTQALSDRVFSKTDGAESKPVPVLLSGTNFQLKVWEALIRIPPGMLVSYGDLARWMGSPTATRAVASAVAANQIAYLIPCHRVIRSMGAFGEYRWGAVRKRALIGWEMAHQSLEAAS
jgi:AraC family transcriptional regulator of adaptative response/methylated-DNA-[protein]-cysteine methyltransferase